MQDPPAVAAYRAALPPGELVEFPLTPLDRLGVPFWLVTFYQQGGPTNAGSGYGLTDDDARIGAFGELAEVVHAHQALPRMARRHGSYRALLREHGPNGIVDPLTLCLEAGSAYTPDMPLHWVETRRYGTGEPVLVPIEWVACQGNDVEPGQWLITLITNGLGAGPSYDHAVAHGLLELIQRDGNSVRFRAMADDTAIDLGGVRDPETRRLLDLLERQGVDVVAKLASTDFGIANVYVVGADRSADDRTIAVMAAACGEAAHPDREQALRKAVLEFAAARARLAFSHGPLGPAEAVTPPGYLERYLDHYSAAGEEPRALDTMLGWYGRSLAEMRALLWPVLAVNERVPFVSLPTVADATPLADRTVLAGLVADRLRGAGFDILVADFSPPDGRVHAVKVIVPGLEVETMSYHRIGERNLGRLLQQGCSFVGVGTPPPGAAPILLTADAQERLGGPAWLDVAELDRLVGPLYGLYREPGRHATALISEGRLTR